MPVAHFVAVGPRRRGGGGGHVERAGRKHAWSWICSGRLKPGAYRVTLALALNGNLVNPEVKVVPYRVGG